MPEICLYARKDGTWCAALRTSPGSPPCWWSNWSSSIEHTIRRARDEARKRWPDAADTGILIGLWGPAAAGAAEQKEGGSDPHL